MAGVRVDVSYKQSYRQNRKQKTCLRARIAANSLALAQRGVPKAPFYLTGQVDGKGFSIHAAGDRVILIDATGAQRDIDLVPPKNTDLADTSAVTNEKAQPNAPADSPVSSLPEPVCPDGSPIDAIPGDEIDPIPPGTSPLDDALRRLDQGLADPPISGNDNDVPQRPTTPEDPTGREGGAQ